MEFTPKLKLFAMCTKVILSGECEDCPGIQYSLGNGSSRFLFFEVDSMKVYLDTFAQRIRN